MGRKWKPRVPSVQKQLKTLDGKQRLISVYVRALAATYKDLAKKETKKT